MTLEEEHRRLNDTLFSGQAFPLQGIFGVKETSVLQYFEKTADEDDINALNEKIK
jgi:hypothetical protein